MLVEMRVMSLILDPLTHVPIVLLKDMEEKIAIPIWIGILEAAAIEMKLNPDRHPISRPMTHDLLNNILETFGIEVKKIVVCDLRDNTFYAEIHLEREGERFVIDARPSDSIALALRSGASIWVDEKVIEQSQTIDLTEEGVLEKLTPKPESSDTSEKSDQEKWAEILERMSPEDFGKYKM